ncbi:MAG TPA: YdbH domain-containing protein, partial [Inquilinus sp.]
LPAGQRVRIGRFVLDGDMPPLTDVDARFGWSQAGGVDLRRVALDWTGAKVSVEGGSGRRRPSVLRIEGLDLARAVATAGLDDVRATGIVDGTIPFRLDRDTIVVENGVLATRGPGEIRYGGAAAPDEIKAAAAAEPGMDTLMTALRNFQYQSLRATLDGRSDGEANVKLAVRGSNPDLYGGFPIALNVNLSGELYVIARRSLALARIGDRIRDYYVERLGRRTEPRC